MAEVIPDEAVEAAVKRIGDAVTVRDIITILEAAAPHMLAEAWEAGHASGGDDRMKWDVAIEFGIPEPEAAANPYKPTP